jgi:hypothetical protein
MSRKIKNNGLAKLAKVCGFQVADLACLLKVKPRTIHYYSTGIYATRSRIEQPLAGIFHLTVEQLRKKLGLPKRQQKEH